MADRPPPPTSCIRMHTGIISQNVSPFLHFNRDPICAFKLDSSLLTQGKIYERVSCTGRDGVDESEAGEKEREEQA